MNWLARLQFGQDETQPRRPIWGLARYLLALLLTAGATLISSAIHPHFSETNLVMVFLLAVVVAALYLGRGPAFLTSVTGVLVFDFFFIPPYFTMAVDDTEYLLTFLVMLITSLVVSQLAAQLREQARLARRQEYEAKTLYVLSRDLSLAEGLDEIIQAVIQDFSRLVNGDVTVYLEGSGEGRGRLIYPQPSGERQSPPDRVPVPERVNWIFAHGGETEQERFVEAECRFFPIKVANRVLGVLQVSGANFSVGMMEENSQVLHTYLNQIGLAVERAVLAEQANRARLLQEAEKVQAAVLNSISHDLRTPLVSITGTLSSFESDPGLMADDTRKRLVANARQNADLLNRLVGNLLDMSRLEAGVLPIRHELNDVQDAIGVALRQMEDRLNGRPVKVNMPPDLPFIWVDFVLIVHVLTNLIDNAVKYSPAQAEIEIEVLNLGANLDVQIKDRGEGIPAEDLTRVFDKFYRVRRPQAVTGTGLGLSICKGIVEGHGGKIWAEARPGGGTIIHVLLPVGADEREDEEA